MTTFTNKHSLPRAFENFETRNPHTGGGADYTVTTLIDSPRIASLQREHADSLTEDVSERVMSILGTAVHKILEDGAADNEIVEERFHAEIGGVKISGQVDLQTPNGDGMILSDYKTTSAFVVQKFPEGKPEHQRQLNSYACLARQNGVEVTGLEVIAVIRDWSDGQARRNRDYPEAPVARIKIPMWSEEDSQKYLEDRVREHQSWSGEDCTDEDMWLRPPKFAVHEFKKSWSKRAKRLFDYRTEAEMFILDQAAPERYRIEERAGEYVRCNNYCNVASFCSQNNRRLMNG